MQWCNEELPKVSSFSSSIGAQWRRYATDDGIEYFSRKDPNTGELVSVWELPEDAVVATKSGQQHSNSADSLLELQTIDHVDDNDEAEAVKLKSDSHLEKEMFVSNLSTTLDVIDTSSLSVVLLLKLVGVVPFHFPYVPQHLQRKCFLAYHCLCALVVYTRYLQDAYASFIVEGVYGSVYLGTGSALVASWSFLAYEFVWSGEHWFNQVLLSYYEVHASTALHEGAIEKTKEFFHKLTKQLNRTLIALTAVNYLVFTLPILLALVRDERPEQFPTDDNYRDSGGEQYSYFHLITNMMTASIPAAIFGCLSIVFNTVGGNLYFALETIYEARQGRPAPPPRALLASRRNTTAVGGRESLPSTSTGQNALLAPTVQRSRRHTTIEHGRERLSTAANGGGMYAAAQTRPQSVSVSLQGRDKNKTTDMPVLPEAHTQQMPVVDVPVTVAMTTGLTNPDDITESTDVIAKVLTLTRKSWSSRPKRVLLFALIATIPTGVFLSAVFLVVSRGEHPKLDLLTFSIVGLLFGSLLSPMVFVCLVPYMLIVKTLGNSATKLTERQVSSAPHANLRQTKTMLFGMFKEIVLFTLATLCTMLVLLALAYPPYCRAGRTSKLQELDPQPECPSRRSVLASLTACFLVSPIICLGVCAQSTILFGQSFTRRTYKVQIVPAIAAVVANCIINFTTHTSINSANNVMVNGTCTLVYSVMFAMLVWREFKSFKAALVLLLLQSATILGTLYVIFLSRVYVTVEETERVVFIAVFHPAMFAIVDSVIAWGSRTLSRTLPPHIAPTYTPEGTHVYHQVLRLMFSLTGRLYLVSVGSFSTSVMYVFLWVAFEIVEVSLLPLITYTGMLVSGSVRNKTAAESIRLIYARMQHHVFLNRSYWSRVLEIVSIIVSLTLYYLYRHVYQLPNLSLSSFILLTVLQLAGEGFSDSFTLWLENNFFRLPTVVSYLQRQRNQMYIREGVVYCVIAGAIAMTPSLILIQNA